MKYFNIEIIGKIAQRFPTLARALELSWYGSWSVTLVLVIQYFQDLGPWGSVVVAALVPLQAAVGKRSRELEETNL